MLATEHSQSLSDFRQNADETLVRLNRTGEAEIITIDGEPRAVLLSPETYDALAREAQLSMDVAVIRRSLQQFEAGDSMEVNAFFAQVRAKLLAMKAAHDNSGEK